MNNLRVGEIAKIIGYSVNTPFTERLRELGLTVGTTIRLLRKAPFNGPIEIQFCFSQIVLRSDEMEHIHLEILK